MDIESKGMLYKDKTGQPWFFGIYSNNFEDREAETITWDGHLEYAEWVKSTGVKLPVTVAHQPHFPLEVHLSQFIALSTGKITADEFSNNYMKMYKPYAFAQTESIIPMNGFMIVVAKILKNKERVAELISQADWGMSHGFLSVDRDSSTLNVYRTFEFTSLPKSIAANSITLSEVTKMDQMKGLSEEDRALLKQVLDADPAELEEATAAAQDILKKVISSKELEQPEPEQKTEDYETLRTKIFADLRVEELNKSFNAIVESVQKLNERIDGFEGRVKQAERSDDEKIADAFKSPVWQIFGDVEEKEIDLESIKEDAIGEKPIAGIKAEGDANNPLYLGWARPMGLVE
ncbi:MAG: hypothetical protein WC196_05085 [Bacilli bacterium]|jgi:hypothetical protein